MAHLNTITPTELAQAHSEGRIQEFWNVLTDDYFTEELIPGSRRVPVDRVGREASGLPKDTVIAVYCSGPACPQSHAAAEKLESLGFSDVLLFQGGLEAWKNEGRPVEEVCQVPA